MVAQLSDEAREFIERKVREGEFADANSVIDMAVRRAAHEDKRTSRLDSALQIGIDELDRGERITWSPEMMDHIWEEAMRRFDVGERVAPGEEY